MKEQFVPYELAVKLKELGFDEDCFYVRQKDCPEFLYTPTDYEDYPEATHTEVLIPLWQQAFDWFREKHNYHYEIFLTNDSPYNKFHYRIMQIGKYFTLAYDDFEGTYEEARQICLEKLIELCKKK